MISQYEIEFVVLIVSTKKGLLAPTATCRSHSITSSLYKTINYIIRMIFIIAHPTYNNTYFGFTCCGLRFLPDLLRYRRMVPAQVRAL